MSCSSFRYDHSHIFWLFSSSQCFLGHLTISFRLVLPHFQTKLLHLHHILHHKHLPPHPSLQQNPLPWFPRTSKKFHFLRSNDESYRQRYLPHGHHGAELSLWGYLLLLGYIQAQLNNIVCWKASLFFHCVWWNLISQPDLYGALSGCHSSHYLPETEKWERDQNQECQHWLCLVVVLFRNGFGDDERCNASSGFLPLGIIFDSCLFL